ncbi:MAG TPA: efflux RND transporter periplasmic adaptor subunit [Verrucomicrobiae bacterium]|nr:efflux RND transporter periplasmic adaptor subunit [Verrucomicrobiae bacterium]
MLTDEKMQTQKPPPAPKPKRERKPDAPQTGGVKIELPQKSSRTVWIMVAALCIIAGLTYWGVKKRQALAAAGAKNFARQPMVPVLAGAVEEKDVPIYLDGLGTVQAYNTVTVKVRVDGELKKVAFVEGQDVHAGDLLAQIDPAPYQAALDQAKAKKAEDQAQLVNAQIGLKRETDLLAAKIDAQQVYDTQKALADQLDATVKADQAAIESAEVNLKYCTITSPITGRTGIRLVDQGNMVHATDTNGLVVITQLQPISVVFTLPEQKLEAIHRNMPDNGQVKVLAVDGEDNQILDEGTLAVIDNQIDIGTGTIRIKANFPNEKNRLWPGEFVNARLLLTTVTNGLVVPTPAVQRGPSGAYVFVIDEGASNPGKTGGKGRHSGSGETNPSEHAQAHTQKANSDGETHGGQAGADNGAVLHVKMQSVTVSPDVTGPDALITSGLTKGQRIVVDGQYKLQDGSQIRIVSPEKSGSVDSRSNDSVQ